MTTPIKPARERKTWDFILTIMLLVVYLGWSLLCSFAGALLGMAGDGSAFLVGVFGPAVLAVIVLIFAIVWIVRRHISFWIPIAGAVLAAAVVVFAWILAGTGVVPFS